MRITLRRLFDEGTVKSAMRAVYCRARVAQGNTRRGERCWWMVVPTAARCARCAGCCMRNGVFWHGTPSNPTSMQRSYRVKVDRPKGDVTLITVRDGSRKYAGRLMTHRDVQPQPPAELCQQALDVLEDALRKPPTQLKAEVDQAERAVVRLRDELIGRWRAAPDAKVHQALEDVNAALSLIVGLEYPMGGLQREMLEQANTALRATLQSGSL